MPSIGQSVTVTYTAWNTSTNQGQTGDSANHTLRWVKDGTAAVTTNTPVEVDSVNIPGCYKLTLTATECTCNFGVLGGKSNTANVSIFPIAVTFEQLPTAAPNATNGLPTVGTGSGQINVASGNVSANVMQIDGQSAIATTSVTFPQTIGTSTYAGGNVTVGGYATNQDPGSYVLATPSQKLATNASGGVTVGGYASGQDPATYILQTPSQKLFTNSSGYVNSYNVTASSPTSGTVVANSVANSFVVSGLPANRSYVGQHLYHGPSGEARVIIAQGYANSNYTFTFGSGAGENGPFALDPTAGDIVFPIP